MAGELIGQVLNNTYRITRQMAQGGMGTVYEAAHVKLTKKRFALKILHQHVSDVADVYQRFLREANIAADLGHPNIVNVTDYQETPEGLPYMVMEYLEGEDLGARLARGAMEPAELMAIVRQVSSALQAAHDRGIVHRDMKPENVFLVTARDGGPPMVKVLDFGISKIRHSKSIVTKNLSIMGTPQYMSPEQGEGEVAQIDHTTDIFALGIICYQALAGALPFDGPSLMAVVRAVCDKQHRPASELRPQLGPAVDRVLDRALAKDRAARYGRVLDFVAELDQALAQSPLTTQPPGPPGYGAAMGNARTMPPGTAVAPAALAPPPATVAARPAASEVPLTMTPHGGTAVVGVDEALFPASPAAIPPTAVAMGGVPPTTVSGSAGETWAPQQRPSRLWIPLVAVGAVLLVGGGVVTAMMLGDRPQPAGETTKAAGVVRKAPGETGKGSPKSGGTPADDEEEIPTKKQIAAAVKAELPASLGGSKPDKPSASGAATGSGSGGENGEEYPAPALSPEALRRQQLWLTSRLRGGDNAAAADRQVRIRKHGNGYRLYVANQFKWTCLLRFGEDGQPATLRSCVSATEWWTPSPLVRLRCNSTQDRRAEVCKGTFRICSGPRPGCSTRWPGNMRFWRALKGTRTARKKPRKRSTNARVVAGRAQTRGSLDREVIRRVIRRHFNEIRFCYQKGLQQNPRLYGRVVLRFTIDRQGKVASAMVQNSTMKHRGVESCMAKAAMRWRFPAPRGGIVVVSYPFVMRATN